MEMKLCLHWRCRIKKTHHHWHYSKHPDVTGLQSQSHK